MSAAVSSITGQPLSLSSARGRLLTQQPVPRGLLGGVAMVTKFDHQGRTCGACVKEGVMAVRPTVGVTTGTAPAWSCGDVTEPSFGDGGSLLSVKVKLDRFGRPTCSYALTSCADGNTRFTPWDYACCRGGELVIPLAKKVANCVVSICCANGLEAYRYSMRNLTHVNMPILTQNAPKCALGTGGSCVPKDLGPLRENSAALVVPLPGANTIVARRLGAGAGTCVRTVGILNSPCGDYSCNSYIALVSGIEFANLSQMGEGNENWYCSCKQACTLSCLCSPLSPTLDTWQNVASFRLRIPVVVPKYRNDDEDEGVICYVTYKTKTKVVSLEAYQQFPHIIQLRFNPQNYDFSCD